jgi:DNA-binding NarL/FixJ family response regulator
MKEGDLELLNEIAKFEDSHDMEKEYRIGWGWRQVRVWPATLSRLFKDGYLLKSAYSEELAQAIRSVRAGEFVCNPELAHKLLKRAASPQPVALDFGEHLTRREAEILKLAAKGLTNRDIAAHLGLNERTVKGHMVNIFGKMQVSSRTEAVLEALKRGWANLEDI